MSYLDASASSVNPALEYAARGWKIFPCWSIGARRKQPLTEHGVLDSTDDPEIIKRWWKTLPTALLGLATGTVSGVVVLDVDVKNPQAYGPDSLDELGFSILPNTPIAHTPSGGFHLYFDPGGHDIRNTTGEAGRGIGKGLDWRGTGGYVIVPSPSSGYSWDPHCNFETLVPVEVPAGLLPRKIEREAVAPIKPVAGLVPYAKAALDNACRRIVAAGPGEQEATINSECHSIGRLAGGGVIPTGYALSVLKHAANQIVTYDAHRPWRANELARKVERAFNDGLRKPRGIPDGRR